MTFAMGGIPHAGPRRANKMDNVEEMDKFLEKYNFLKRPGRNRKS